MPDLSDPLLRFAVRIEPLGRAFEASAGVPLLLSARAAGVALPVSCRNGTCRTCLCRAASGRVAYRIEWPGLSAEEKAEGCLLPCVAYPLSDLVLQAPAARALDPQG